jgi:hypothetical protein
MKAALQRVSLGAEWLLALLVFAVASRLAWVAVADRLERPEPEAPVVEQPTSRAPALAWPKLPPLPSELLEPPPAPAVEAGAADKETLRVTLVIALGPERSEVFVNGVAVGQSPYVGDWTCRRDEPLRIDVLPPRGAPLHAERPCSPGTVRVGE